MKDIKIIPFIIIAITIVIWLGWKYFASEPSLSQSANQIAEIDQIITTLDKNGQFSGALLIAMKGEIIYKNAVGYADLMDSIPNTCDTKFRIASFTKPITAMLILQLVEEGKLKLDGKLTDYLPEFPKGKEENITIHQLLTHTAGITGESRIANLIDIEKEYYSRERLLNCIAEKELVYEPGKGREYSNFGYALLGLVIEEVSGKSYNAVLQEKICQPAGMKNTLEDVTAQPIENRAIGYNYNYFTGLEEASFLDMSFCLGAGQLLSTVEDLYLFDKALYSDKLLNEESKDLFFNSYGWHYQKCRIGKGLKRIRSNSLDGSINGFGSHTQRIEKDTVFIVALRNTKEYKRQIVIKWPDYMVSRILAVLYGEEYDLPKKSGAYAIFKEMIDSGKKEAENLSDKIMTKQTNSYYLNNREFRFFEEELKKKGMESQATDYRKIHEQIK